jgi:predicted Fe-S protein YdhL (DUF1289 family)
MADAAHSLPVIDSPCIQICTLGPSGICVGCFRTAEEIGDWLKYSAEQRQAIMAELPDRADGLFED